MRNSLAADLARATIDSMVASGVTQEAFLHGAIKATDMPWQTPPLVVEAPLLKIPLHQYFEQSIYVSTEQLLNLWSDALLNMRNKPHTVLTEDGYRAMSYALRKLTPQERRLCLSVPEGYPGSISDMAGATLSMEVAHLLRFNVRCTDFINDEDNYYAVLPTGQEVGIKDGLPSMFGEEWDLPVKGMVQEMLATGRGVPEEVCHYDIIDKTRAVLHNPEYRFEESEAIEWALQTLRILGGQTVLIRAVKGIKQRALQRQNRLQMVLDAHEVAHRFAISDRARITTLRGLLVPDVLTPGEFSSSFYPYAANPPAIVHAKVLARIHAAIDALLERERERDAK